MNQLHSSIAGLAIAALVTTVPSTVLAGGPATSTSGDFASTAAGTALGYDIGGHATMVRTAADTTKVVVHPTGLRPNTVYGTHVHNGPCSSGGGGNYQHAVGGGVDPVNEMWPTVTTNAAGNGRGQAHHAHTARAQAQSVVIHEPGSGVRIACLDLG